MTNGHIIEKEKIFYSVGYPNNYARAYIKGDIVYFDVGQMSCGISCGGQIIKTFSKLYAKNNSFEKFLIDLNVDNIINVVLGQEHAKHVLDEMWKYLCEASL